MVVPDKKRLFYLSWLTLFGMGAMGVVLITYLQKKDAYEVLINGKKYGLQVLTGLFFGGIASLLAVLLIKNPRFKTVRNFFQNLLREIQPTFANILFYSFCAGVGEEILFRAGIQPLIGIWPAAILFVFLHGYINPSNLTLTVYGIFLVVICSGFGYLFKFFGIGSSITAHFVYDVSMFSLLRYSSSENGNSP
jgi:membrane protease YdiL (CAAX protease family)